MRALPLVALTLMIAVPAKADTAQQAFFARLSTLCGKSFQGKVVTTDPADACFNGKPLVMYHGTSMDKDFANDPTWAIVPR